MLTIVSANFKQQYIGCYNDGGRANRVMIGSVERLVSNQDKNIIMTLEVCQQYCQQSAETYFGVEVQLCVS